MLAIGLMSGTSLDGIDAALVDIVPHGDGYRVETLRFETNEFDADLRSALFDALPPNSGAVADVAVLHHRLGKAYARAARRIAGADPVRFVASHGQTVWHDGEAHITLQLGDPFVIREALDVTVCYDFRSADCAAGGHGAPLVAYVDALLLGDAGEDRVVLNLGGIANVTLLRKGAAPSEAIAFDTGPGNMLIDALVRRRTGGEKAFDRDGAFAAAGRVDAALLEAMLDDEYFMRRPPKTTGRERFGEQFLAQHEALLCGISIEDAAATLAELTAASVADAIGREGLPMARVIVSGGGSRNPSMLERLAARLPRTRVETSDAMGIPADAKEAVAFAVLGYETLRGRPANIPTATGARRAVVLGSIAPYHLGAVLAQLDRECRR